MSVANSKKKRTLVLFSAIAAASVMFTALFAHVFQDDKAAAADVTSYQGTVTVSKIAFTDSFGAMGLLDVTVFYENTHFVDDDLKGISGATHPANDYTHRISESTIGAAERILETVDTNYVLDHRQQLEVSITDALNQSFASEKVNIRTITITDVLYSDEAGLNALMEN